MVTWRWRILLLMFFSSNACVLRLEQRYQRLRPYLLQKNYSAALKSIEAGKNSFYGSNNALLYWMDKASVLRMAKQLDLSNRTLEAAKREQQRLDSHSVSAEVLAAIGTDNSLPYHGEDFERVMLHVLAALNRLEDKQLEEARVEARQIVEDLALYAQKYGSHTQHYSDDGLARFLSGFIAQLSAEQGNFGDFSDAWIDYKRAIALYENRYPRLYQTSLPKIVLRQALWVLAKLGGEFLSERQRLVQRYGNVMPLCPDAQQARLVVFVESGEAPYKTEQFWTALVGPDVLRIAFPVFVPKNNPVARTGVRVLQGQQAVAQGWAEKIEDIGQIAIVNLQDHMERIKAKAIARAVAKFSVGVGAEIAGAEIARKNEAVGLATMAAGFLWNIGQAAAEHADMRSWITLPARIDVAELLIPVGTSVVELVMVATNGRVLGSVHIPVYAKAKETVFVGHRSLI